jgi:TolB-like protein/integral membrane sensor domain MASE1/class 3 adenylate cyclase/Tfp pilus assembly protein PilF
MMASVDFSQQTHKRLLFSNKWNEHVYFNQISRDLARKLIIKIQRSVGRPSPKRTAARNLLKVANGLVSVRLGRGLGNMKIMTALVAGKRNWMNARDRSAEPTPDVDRKGSWATQSRRFSGLPLIGILAVIYFIAGKLGLMLASLHASASPVWPPAGIALAALLLLGYRVWPAIFVGAFLVNVTTAGNVATSFAIATGNTLEALAGAWLVNRFAGGTFAFDRPQGVFKFALAAAISTVISPALGVTSLAFAGFADWTNCGAIWLTWWLGDATGDLVFTPLVLLWSVASKRHWNKKEAAEVGALLLLLVLLSGVVFGGWPAVSTRNYPIVLICGPVVIWTAFRFTQRETAMGIFILSAIAVWGTLHGFGPFVRETENQSLLALQWWTAVLSITAMALSAGMAERRRVEEELQQQKGVVAKRTKDHFLAMLSHELRTPLTPVISALESLETESAQTEGDRSVEPTPDLPLEIAHVLLIDVVGYSKLLVNEQIECLQDLNRIVQSTECCRTAEASGKLRRVPMGDGMALLFFNSPEEPVRCALEISRTLQEHPHIQVRMGVHSGPVNRVRDVNDKTNFAGSGINVAQRVMDCGDAGHILLSGHVANDLSQYRHWQPWLHDLGECEVKHGLRLHLFNLCKENLGNSQVPEKFRRRRRWKEESDIVRPVSLPRRPRSLLVLGLVVAALAMVISSLTFFQRVSLRITPSTPPEETGSKGTVLIPEKSIAVLPFENRSEEKTNVYFADGIQQEILTRLSKIADLKVISRTSTQHYKSTPEDLPEVARQLGVAYILEGSVQKSRDAVRVNVQLIKAANDFDVWADTFDRKLTDIFSVESEVAKAIAEQLQAKLTGQEEQVIAARPTDNVEAYAAYLRGLAYTLKTDNTAANALGAQKYLREAVRLDPKFALSWALLSYIDARGYITESLQPTVALREEARQAAETALTLQPNLGEAILAKGQYYYACLKDYDNAVRYFEQARQFLPNNSRIPMSLGLVARRRGQWDQSDSYFNEAERLDPRNVSLITQHAISYIALRRFPEALRKLDQVLDITPDDADTLATKAAIAQAEGDLPRASAILAPLRPAADDTQALEGQVYQAILEHRPAPIIPRLKDTLAKPNPALGYINGRLRFWLGWAQEVAGDHAAAQASWRQARSELESFLKEQPENYSLIGILALTNAGLREKGAALALSERAMAALPTEKDAIVGPARIEIFARVAAQMSEPDRAIGALQKLLSIPFVGPLPENVPLTPALLRLDPMFDPLRNDPRFQKLAASPAGK